MTLVQLLRYTWQQVTGPMYQQGYTHTSTNNSVPTFIKGMKKTQAITQPPKKPLTNNPRHHEERLESPI